MTNKDRDQKWRNLLEKSAKRKRESRVKEEDVKSIFFSIDKDRSGEITPKVPNECYEMFIASSLFRKQCELVAAQV